MPEQEWLSSVAVAFVNMSRLHNSSAGMHEFVETNWDQKSGLLCKHDQAVDVFVALSAQCLTNCIETACILVKE